MNLIDVTRKFKTDDDCLDYLEAFRWPKGVCCIKCGVIERLQDHARNKGKNKRTRLYQCLEKECRPSIQPDRWHRFPRFTPAASEWFMAMALICEAKKGISAKQVSRHLGLEKSYKTAWYLCHRIRKAMKEGGLLGGDGGVVEADETYMHPRKPRKGKPYVKEGNRSAVLGMIERGGKLRLIPIADAKMATVEPELRKARQPRCYAPN